MINELESRADVMSPMYEILNPTRKNRRVATECVVEIDMVSYVQ